jgi:acyl-coenzyme A synthetase/AMP-(fatty) acid ligase
MGLVPPGVPGTLYVGGPGVSRGYLGRARETAAAFVPHPQRPGERIYRTGDLGRRRPDGLFELLGRADSQIKSRGYRIELGEVEAALGTLHGLRESAVVAVRSDGFEQWLICCAYVPLSRSARTPGALRRALAALLPGYMLPVRWQALAALPRNANGKVDRARLRQDFETWPQASLTS